MLNFATLCLTMSDTRSLDTNKMSAASCCFRSFSLIQTAISSASSSRSESLRDGGVSLRLQTHSFCGVEPQILEDVAAGARDIRYAMFVNFLLHFLLPLSAAFAAA